MDFREGTVSGDDEVMFMTMGKRFIIFKYLLEAQSLSPYSFLRI